LFLDESIVDLDTVNNLLNILGLLNALILGASLSLSYSIGYDDLLAVDDRFWAMDSNDEGVSNYSEYWRFWYDLPPSTQLYVYQSNSLSLLFIGILIIVYVYADGLSKNEKITDSDETRYHRAIVAKGGRIGLDVPETFDDLDKLVKEMLQVQIFFLISILL